MIRLACVDTLTASAVTCARVLVQKIGTMNNTLSSVRLNSNTQVSAVAASTEHQHILFFIAICRKQSKRSCILDTALLAHGKYSYFVAFFALSNSIARSISPSVSARHIRNCFSTEHAHTLSSSEKPKTKKHSDEKWPKAAGYIESNQKYTLSSIDRSSIAPCSYLMHGETL